MGIGFSGISLDWSVQDFSCLPLWGHSFPPFVIPGDPIISLDSCQLAPKTFLSGQVTTRTMSVTDRASDKRAPAALGSSCHGGSLDLTNVAAARLSKALSVTLMVRVVPDQTNTFQVPPIGISHETYGTLV